MHHTDKLKQKIYLRLGAAAATDIDGDTYVRTAAVLELLHMPTYTAKPPGRLRASIRRSKSAPEPGTIPELPAASAVRRMFM
jgi:hypothetical protein